ncbi:V/A-type H+-transporting ATPase subunit D [Hydrogenispora ethanolica]|uniref:V-type ATP synthase subunit D n=1 Tax=Hydrogenispora ethanolica TaxID=1082276 RepID=A0A4R1SBX1_HYDET|nr:V-type ATP synthase subunit D [Hydrogenispora ethanolica]TCL76929.1 V/A-type H+-transporting ATPase subunit D [Hydrogenispora ethanolica]
MEIRVNPTRMELLRLKKRLKVAVRGHKLLKDKFDELMKNFMKLVEEERRLRQAVEAVLAEALQGFMMARAVMSRDSLEGAIARPKVKAEISAATKTVMGIEVPAFTLKEPEYRGGIYPYGFAQTSGELDQAIRDLSRSLKELIQLAEVEKTVELLAAEIERTRRRVNALEYVMIPQLEEAIKRITMKLDENERGNLTRLMKIKDMVREKQT